MDPVDVLTMGAHAAQLIRSGNDPEKIIRGAYQALKLAQPEDSEDSLALRIIRLTEAAGAERDKLMQYLNQQAGPLPLNRPSRGWGGAVEPAAALAPAEDAEAEALIEYVEAEEEAARDMMGDFPAFSVAQKRVDDFFGGEEPSMESEGLPTIVHGLIDYPLKRPCLFAIEVGEEPWSLWDICCAFADQYARIYEESDKYGVWGHDLTDLWIERLLYYPEKQLIYAHVGS